MKNLSYGKLFFGSLLLFGIFALSSDATDGSYPFPEITILFLVSSIIFGIMWLIYILKNNSNRLIIQNFVKKYYTDIIILSGILILSCSTITRHGDIEIGKVVGIMLVAIGGDLVFRKSFKK